MTPEDVMPRFSFLMDLYQHHLVVALDDDGDDAHVAYLRVCALRSCLLVLVDTSIFVSKSLTYVNVIYLRYFINL